MTEESNKMRVVRVPVHTDFLISLILEDCVPNRYTRVIQGLPADSKLVGAYTEMHERTVYLVFTHPSFEICPVGQVPPTFTPVIEAKLLK